jgi:hypothetical protein
MDCIERGKIVERERIIRLLESKKVALEAIDLGHAKGSEINSIRTKTISSILELIKGAA